MKIRKSHSSSAPLPTPAIVFVLCLLVATVVAPANSQSLTGTDRERGRVMLDQIKDDIKKNYYDPAFHGVDVDAQFKAADDKLKRATSLGQVFGIIAQSVLSLNDSHTFFVPPTQTLSSDYGWEVQAIGDECYVVAVKPGSDAEVKGLKAGDLIISVNGIPLKRDELWKFRYLYYALRPQPGMQLVVQGPDSQPRTLSVLAKIRNDKQRLDFTGMTGGADIWNTIREIERKNQLRRQRHHELGNDLLIWKMPQFDLSLKNVDAMIDRMMSRKAVILDLRGNSGGAETTLLHLIGRFFDKDVSVGSLKRRKETKQLRATTHDPTFKGKLAVLVDSDSASAAEMFARMVQLEQRGTVIGDRTEGAVMRSRFHPHQMGMDVAVFYGASVTDADVIMPDGKSLERAGVAPDVFMLPSAKDLASKRDPVLAHAASLLGFTIDPQKAGALFPREWK